MHIAKNPPIVSTPATNNIIIAHSTGVVNRKAVLVVGTAVSTSVDVITDNYRSRDVIERGRLCADRRCGWGATGSCVSS